ncbi:c-type cytochrome [Rhizobium leguminosarum]|uniref:cytochrome-c peroxidase n=1 Tax=Rhizobium leguminosarum TaxID=384 RepID=UPI001C97875E|nr:cytochrome c peroxidase [Rhizobium leguminosarum]MBY5538275.1 c-type cytochrome [Rhizobium leguminosarum]
MKAISRAAVVLIPFLLWGLVSGAPQGAAQTDSDAQIVEPITAIAPPGNLEPDKVQLGEMLFADKQLSSKGMLACLSCHDLSVGGTVRERRTIGYDGRTHRFNAPSIFNVGLNYRLGWRGNFTSLELQNEAVLLDRNLMSMTWPELIARLRANRWYAAKFKATYGREVRREDVLNALATYERSLVTPDAPFDRYLSGKITAISGNAINGYRIFKQYGCASCHQGVNVGGNVFQKFGIFSGAEPSLNTENDGNLGRWTVTHSLSDIGVFRVPSLRNVELTAPYFHDGRTDTLDEAVRIMGRTQLGQELSDREVEDLVNFLETLTGKYRGKSLQSTR